MTDQEATPRPHICGDPSDPCDAECMERAYEARARDEYRRLLQVEQAAKAWHEDKVDLETCGYPSGTVGRNLIAARSQTSEAALRRLVGGVME